MKTESTSQTYGQLVVVPKRKDATVSSNSGDSLSKKSDIVVSQKDTVVNVSKSSTLVDRRQIIIAAATSKESVVNLAAGASDVETAIVLGSSLKSKEDVGKALTEAQKVDLSICLKSKESETIQFNTIKTPEIKGDFVYNFFTPDESSIESEEDQSKDPLLKTDISRVPRYVHLKWDAAKISEPLTSEEQGNVKPTQLKRDAILKNRGIASNKNSNFKNSYQKSLKKTNLFDYDGVKSEIVDIHKLDVAFNSTANKKVFSNSVSAVFNISSQRNVVDSLPVVIKDVGGEEDE